MLAVIDTNCLLASIPAKSNYYWLYEAFIQQKFDWLIGNEILTEYEEKIIDIYSEKAAHLVLNILSVAPNVIYAEPYFKWNLITQDDDDNKFVDLAIAGNADHIVTNDRHFSPLKTLDFPKLSIVTLNEFKDIIFS